MKSNQKSRVRFPIPEITYPDELPVSVKRDEIAQAVSMHQVVIVCGETGSGKTTQLPKICLDIGRGDRGLIGHTQPRRLAATSVAKRIAEELGSPMGQIVGYQVRFQDKTHKESSIKLMTDGILLAETQRDPLLKHYDTLIIDEAHERSLNIDFLLGYLKQLLPKRPDLKLIITSATIDATRFAEHFADAKGHVAPVIEVSGRTYPVDIRYRPVDTQEMQSTDNESNHSSSQRDVERDLIDAMIDAVHECVRHGPGDILVFLPGEREIRESAEALAKSNLPLDVLALFARLSQADQDRVFQTKHTMRRVVLATNVAETSLTVPGICFVIDTGLARVKRYSWRNKVEQLRIEPISQASANQRAGRCGRIAPGVCIRLYDELDFSQRPPFTDPEILRSSLASVILRMKSLRLNDIEGFPFIQAPSGRAIADGYHILTELGALDENNHLTKVGKALATLPLDPKVGRMILSAKDHHCLKEMLVIAAALSVQDPRERPMDAQAAADQAHTKFVHDQSEFFSLLKLWDWYQEQWDQRESNRKLQDLLRKNYVSPIRLREWRDVHQQLRLVIQEHGWSSNDVPATYEQVHLALLSGLLGNIALKSEETNQYQGTRGLRLVIHPSSRIQKKVGRWLVAAELVETTRLFARCIAKIDPRWIENVGAHLMQKQWSDPRWDDKRGQVVANERATLYGLPIYHGRKVHYGRINPTEAREIFIKSGLVGGELLTSLPFLAHNLKLISSIEKLEHKSRRPDILVDDELVYAFYDRQLPTDIVQQAQFEHWYQSQHQADLLYLSRDELMRHEAAGITSDVFPKYLTIQGVNLALDYHFEPGSHKDGVTLSVPLYLLNQVDADRCDWLVLGMLKEKVHLLLKSLPQKLRRHCVPLPDYAQGFYDRWYDRYGLTSGNVAQALIIDIREQKQLQLSLSDFKYETLPPHLQMNFRVLDEHGRMLSSGRHLAQLKSELGRQAQSSFQQLAADDKSIAQVLEHESITTWSFGELPELLEIKRKKTTVIGYPALVDKQTHCELDVFDDPDEAQRKHTLGLVRLFRFALKEQIKFLEKNINGMTNMGMLYMSLGTQEELRDQIIDVAIIQSAMLGDDPKNEHEFVARVQEAKAKLGLLTQEIARLCLAILTEWNAAQRKLVPFKTYKDAYADINQQLQGLVTKGFAREIPYAQLTHVPRYLKAVQSRIEKMKADPARDTRWMTEVLSMQTLYQKALIARKGQVDERLVEFKWLLQELRVALFAQELRTPMPVSVKRLQKVWESISR